MEKKSAQIWIDELARYKEAYEKFTERGDKVVKRYRDERKESENIDSRFNILWSNVRTLKPAIYSKPPKPEVSRRFKDKNPIARCASTIIERCLSYEITQYTDYHSALSNAVEDRLLPGRGVAWLRYEPVTETVETEPTISEDSEVGDEDQDASETADGNAIAGEEPLEKITSETTRVDYVSWKDFAHLPARTWEEVTWVARRVYLSKSEGEERFGDEFSGVPLTHSPDEKDNEKSSTKELQKAEIWEIWSKSSKKVIWIAANYDYILDEKDDPLELEEFFPCPKPIYATITTNSLVPIADYVQYQDQANEIDEITGRIKHLTKSLKVMGIYAADEPAVGRLLKEGQDSVMIPVTNWAAFMEKGGLSNAVQMLPLRDVATTLIELYQAREACKQIVYEVTGISDILRGASQASETATAQQIKSQFASIRLNDMKDDVARFARDLLRMKAEIICSKYQPETLVNMSGIMATDDAQFVPQAIQLLKNDAMRQFAIDIENDTLVQLDEQTEKQNRIEFLQASGQFLNQAVQAAQLNPDLLPLMGEMLLFGIRGFKIGRGVEGAFESTLEQIKQKQAQAAQQPPQPNPEMLKMQAEQQGKQADMQLRQAELQQAGQIEQMKLQAAQQSEQIKAQLTQQSEQAKAQLTMQIEQNKLDHALQIKAMEIEKTQAFDKWKAELEANTKVVVAEVSANSAKETTAMGINAATDAETAKDQGLDGLVQAINENMSVLLGAQSEHNARVLEVLSKPKTVVRGSDGKVIGVQ